MSATQDRTEDSKAVATQAGLRYVSDKSPGFTRKKAGSGFMYLDAKGKHITDPEVIARIQALSIPPAYSDVWICPYENGHIQATGMDARGRKQYRYHTDWQNARQATKYNRMREFGHALPKIRRQVNADLKLPGVPREKVIATLVQLLEKTLIRVGNEEYAKENKSFGLTTLQSKHVEVEAHEIKFAFKGKSNQYHEITLQDKRLARIVSKLQDLPGQELFQYVDDNDNLHEIHSDDINQYLQEVTGQDFTAKDFRTWKGTVLAAKALLKCEACKSKTQAKRNLNAAIRDVASELGNTPGVCRKAYIHPKLIATYTTTMTLECLNCTPTQLEEFKHLHKDEASIMVFLENH
ncbi:MAG TPA: DNA topoisomerase IB [Patescibacteria group bacterium]